VNSIERKSEQRNHSAALIPIFVLLLTACGWQGHEPHLWDKASSAAGAVIRVAVTSQGYTFHRPWQQRRPTRQNGIGVIVPHGRVLVTAMLVANHRYIELEAADTQRKGRAEVEVVDYEANLALLKPVDEDFLAGRQPLQLCDPLVSGQSLHIWQVKPDGDVVPSEARITSIELSPYSQDNYFLTYRLNGSLQYGFNNLTLPAIRGNRLAGLVLRYNPGGQTIDVISTSVIRHFLTDAGDGHYLGFPRAGFHYGPTMDPQLRRYIDLKEGQSGIYVQKVIKGGPADRAGLRAGDVIARVGDFNISNTGQYEHPLYGKTSLIHLVRTTYYVGDSIPVQVYRNGHTLDLAITATHRRPDQYLIPPYIIDKPPEYLIVGGLVFEELSVSYLLEYGKDWASQAPIDLVYYQQNQEYLNGDQRDQREKIVILSDVIPTPFSIGYEDLNDLVVLRVNGRRIGKLADVRSALKKPVEGFHRIEVEQDPGLLFLDPKQIDTIHQIIRERYRIPIPPL
jgi:S1-C subfamily serine protease